jgi:sugar phosphate permease
MEIQTRSEENGLRFYGTWEAAFKAAKSDKTIWKISWADTNGGSIRMVRCGIDGWAYEPIILPEMKQ